MRSLVITLGPLAAAAAAATQEAAHDARVFVWNLNPKSEEDHQ